MSVYGGYITTIGGPQVTRSNLKKDKNKEQKKLQISLLKAWNRQAGKDRQWEDNSHVGEGVACKCHAVTRLRGVADHDVGSR